MRFATTQTTNPLHAFSAYRFHFNGVERDDEIKGSGNSYAFDYRIHDTRLGRFLSIDPDYQKYPSQSSYCFAANSPIRFIDSEGKGVLDKIVTFFSRTYNFITKGDFKTNYEIQKKAYQNALQARYDYYNMVVELDPTQANNDYLLSIPFLVDKFDAPNPDKHKIMSKNLDVFERTEEYLNSESQNFGQASDKVVGNILYGLINSPYILLTGESLGGEQQTPKGKMDAFVDFVPGKLFGSLNSATIIKIKGGYKDFAKQTKGKHTGTSDQIFKERMNDFKTNDRNVGAVNGAVGTDKAKGAATEIKKETDK